ncbi:hypothetical protein ESP60_02545 [Anaplasma phagocytophilum]|nr:hypothetical protein ESP60_02545 [Anaplasma phagocytophilum]
MMLLLGRLITLLLLLPKSLVRTSFSLLRRLRYPPPPLMGRFVGPRMDTVHRPLKHPTGRMPRKQTARLKVKRKQHSAGVRVVQVEQTEQRNRYLRTL